MRTLRSRRCEVAELDVFQAFLDMVAYEAILRLVLLDENDVQALPGIG